MFFELIFKSTEPPQPPPPPRKLPMGGGGGWRLWAVAMLYTITYIQYGIGWTTTRSTGENWAGRHPTERDIYTYMYVYVRAKITVSCACAKNTVCACGVQKYSECACAKNTVRACVCQKNSECARALKYSSCVWGAKMWTPKKRTMMLLQHPT